VHIGHQGEVLRGPTGAIRAARQDRTWMGQAPHGQDEVQQG
jgi:hypothetical protein